MDPVWCTLRKINAFEPDADRKGRIDTWAYATERIERHHDAFRRFEHPRLLTESPQLVHEDVNSRQHS